ncbi:hypothetical protein BH20GEM2_BH20GEM2_04410 [soil metagenome]
MSSIPPDTAAEVEKLEELHQQHPEGRYFVPLADRYRKLGMVEQAEELLREGLRKHPDYLSAHIVLGGCLADRGVLEEAGDEFRYVLSQDPQNLIALRTLGELAAQGGRGAEAERWYGELLTVDPMNKEARQALDALAGERPEPRAAHSDDARASEVPSPVDGTDPLQDWGTVLLDDPGPPSLDVEADHFDTATFSEVTFTTAGGDDEEPSGGAERADDLDLSLLDTEPDRAFADAPSDEEGWTLLDFGGNESAEEDVASEEDEEEVVTETIADLYAQQGLHDRAAGVYRELVRRRGGDDALEAKLAASERAQRGEEIADEVRADTADFLTFSEDEFGGADSGDFVFGTSAYGDEEPGAAPVAASEAESPPESNAFAASFSQGFEGYDEVEAESAEPASDGSAPAIRPWFADLLDWTPGAARSGAEAAAAATLPADEEPWAMSHPVPGPDEPEPLESLALTDVREAEPVPLEAETQTEQYGEDEEDLSWLTDILDDGADSADGQETDAPAPSAEAPQPLEEAGEGAKTEPGDEDLASFQAWLQSLKR